MATKILMPALSPTMEEGKLSKWLKTEGDAIVAGDAVAEIETDKATMEVEAAEDGTLAKILVAEGTDHVKVNAPIALLLGEDEDESALDEIEAPEGADAQAQQSEPAPGAKEDEEKRSPKESKRGEEKSKADTAQPAPATPERERGGRVPASPIARRMAEEAGLDLGALEGSGPHGRIVKADVAAALEDGAPARSRRDVAPAVSRPHAVVPRGGGSYTDTPHSKMRTIIAERLVDAKQTVPHFYLTIECAIDKLLALRKELNAKSDTYTLSVNDFLIRALALALRRVPEANGVWMEEAIRRYSSVDVAVAVAINEGLVTPVIRDADQKGLAEISNEVKELAARARKKPMGLSPEEYQGGTTSLSNLGMYGVREFAAIINPPQATILAVGEGAPRPVVKAGELAVATMMSCTLSCDHRVVDGALGARLLQAFKGLVEDPMTMLL